MIKIFSIIALGLIITLKAMAYEEANYEVVKQNNRHKKLPPSKQATLPLPPPSSSSSSNKWNKLQRFVVNNETSNGPDAIQRELKKLIINIFSMIHMYVFRHNDYSIDRIINTGIERLKRFVGDALTHDVVSITRLLLISLINKIMIKKNNTLWRDDFNNHEWNSLFQLIKVVKEFLFKKKIPSRIDLDDNDDYFNTCTPYELFNDRCIETYVSDPSSSNESKMRVLSSPDGGRSMLRQLKKAISKEIKNDLMNKNSNHTVLNSVGLHLDPHTFHCLDNSLVDAVCKLMNAIGYKEKIKSPPRKRRQSLLVQMTQAVGCSAFTSVNDINKKHFVEHALTSNSLSSMKRNELDRRTYGADILRDFRDIQSMFQKINSIGGGENSQKKKDDDGTALLREKSSPSVTDIADLFEHYMTKSKKRTKTGLISSASKKQVVKQLRGGLTHMKARKMIKAQKTLHVEKTKVIAISKNQLKLMKEASDADRRRRMENGKDGTSNLHIGRSSITIPVYNDGEVKESEMAAPFFTANDINKTIDMNINGVKVDDNDIQINDVVIGNHDCHKCGLRMSGDQLIFAFNKYWCIENCECFRCIKCSKVPSNLTYFEDNEDVYCADCYLESTHGAHLCGML